MRNFKYSVNFAISALVFFQTRDRLVLEIIVLLLRIIFRFDRIETKDQGHPLNDLFSIQNIE